MARTADSATTRELKRNSCFSTLQEAKDSIHIGDKVFAVEKEEDEERKQKDKIVTYTVTGKYKSFFLAENIKTKHKTSFLYSELITGEVKHVRENNGRLPKLSL